MFGHHIGSVAILALVLGVSISMWELILLRNQLPAGGRESLLLHKTACHKTYGGKLSWVLMSRDPVTWA